MAPEEVALPLGFAPEGATEPEGEAEPEVSAGLSVAAPDSAPVSVGLAASLAPADSEPEAAASPPAAAPPPPSFMQSSLEPFWTETSEEKLSAPVESTTLRVSEVPAGWLTVQVSELLLRVPKSTLNCQCHAMATRLKRKHTEGRRWAACRG